MILLVALLVEVVFLPSFSQFTGEGGTDSSGGFIVIAKGELSTARVEIQIWPAPNSTQSQPTQVTFPNGTTVELVSKMSFYVYLPSTFNAVTYSALFNKCGFDVEGVLPSAGTTVNVVVLPYSFLAIRIQSIFCGPPSYSFYVIDLNGSAQVAYEAWGTGL